MHSLHNILITTAVTKNQITLLNEILISMDYILLHRSVTTLMLAK